MTLPLLTSIVGARPQFIKAAPLISAIAEQGDMDHELIHTGQHYDKKLSEIFFHELNIPGPTANLEIGSSNHAAQTGKMLIELEQQLTQNRPDLLIIYGDTNSTLAGALVGVKMGIPIAHVEAGLRSFNRRMPEEINRIVADRFSDLLFAPTPRAINNLKAEGFAEFTFFLTGDLMVDAVHTHYKKGKVASGILSKLKINNKEFGLATFHRQENTENRKRLQTIWSALIDLSKDFPIVLPLHPGTRKRLVEKGIDTKDSGGLIVINPVGYLDMLQLLGGAKILLTDSGGMQKEAYALEVPCVTLREESEWTELLEAGVNTLAPPTSKNAIQTAANDMILKGFTPLQSNLYGNGSSAKLITNALWAYFNKN